MTPIFSRNKDIDKIAFLNWRISKGDEIFNLLSLADGFLMSAVELSKRVINDNTNKEADVLIFPILANANHGIELYMKAILQILYRLTGTKYDVKNTHNLKKLFGLVKNKVSTYGGRLTESEFTEATLNLSEYINELFDKINATEKNDKMDFSRYPFSGDNSAHFYVSAVRNVEIDLENFVNRFQHIHQVLDNLSSFLLYVELYQDE